MSPVQNRAGSGLLRRLGGVAARRCAVRGLVVGSTAIACAAFAAPALADPPTANPPPSINGTAEDGQQLTEVPATWSPTPDSVTVQWQDCTDSSGTNCSGITGAPTTTSSSYLVTDSDVGNYIRVVEIADSGGAVAAASSALVGVVTTPSTTALQAAPNAMVVTNQLVTLVATVTSRASAFPPSGSVAFMNGATAVPGCESQPVSDGAAICQTSFPVSSPQLTAVFTPSNGSFVVESKTDSVMSLTIGQDASSTLVEVPSIVTVGHSATFTATIAPPPTRPGPVEPSGTVEFLDGGQPIPSCTNQALTTGGATCTVTYAAAGQHAITAVYSGDANFTSSASPSQTVSIVAPTGAAPPPTGATQIFGAITATMAWTFSFTPHYTQVQALTLGGAKNTKVIIRCTGRGCPFRSRVRTVGSSRRCGKHARRGCAAPGTLNLMPLFGQHRLYVGTHISVAITRPAWIGKYYVFAIRAGQGPRVRVTCLAPGRTRPGGSC